jgi:hypothetical protein
VLLDQGESTAGGVRKRWERNEEKGKKGEGRNVMEF